MIDVFLVASKGIPARYGGFETFAEKLVQGKQNEEIRYHVSCMDNDEKHFEYCGADCFNVKVPFPGPAGRIFHVARVLGQIVRWKKENPDSQTIVYVLGCRIGPLMRLYAKKLRALQVTVCVNPDGLEWKRAKWSGPAKSFLKYCEKCLVTNADLIICDSKSIEAYIRKTYQGKIKKTAFLAYGAKIPEETDDLQMFEAWKEQHQISENGYFLIVGRFVPDNNYQTMLKEFMTSDTKKDLVIVTNAEKNKFYQQLRKETGFPADERIKFVGTVYEEKLLQCIRKKAFAYLHGHEVGGTNPSLLEALAATGCNILLDVGFNKEVAEDAAIYWSKENGALKEALAKAEKLTADEYSTMAHKAKARILEAYRWENIISAYEQLFVSLKKGR